MDAIIKCIIIDDEANAHYVLKNYIDRDESLSLVGQYYHADEVGNIPVDLIFLDINMPDVNGFELLAKLKTKAKVILTTAYSDFALKAFDYGVLDYLVKPIPYARFEQAIKLLKHSINLTLADVALEQEKEIILKVDQEEVSFPLKEIIYLQSWGNYIKLYTENKTYLCTATTVSVEDMLPKTSFVRIHKSYIVGLNYVSSFSNDGIFIESLDVLLPIGITYKRTLIDLFKR